MSHYSVKRFSYVFTINLQRLRYLYLMKPNSFQVLWENYRNCLKLKKGVFIWCYFIKGNAPNFRWIDVQKTRIKMFLTLCWSLCRRKTSLAKSANYKKYCRTSWNLDLLQTIFSWLHTSMMTPLQRSQFLVKHFRKRQLRFVVNSMRQTF